MALPIIGNLLGGQNQNAQDQQTGPKKKGFADNVAGVYNTLNNWRLTEWDRSMAALKGNLSQADYYKSQEEQDVQKLLEQEKLDTSNTLLANLLMKGGDPETKRQEVMKIADWIKTPIGKDLVDKAVALMFKTQKDNTRKEEDQLISDRAKLDNTTDEMSTDILNNRIQNNPATKRYDQNAREELKNSIGDLNNTISQANQNQGVDIPTIDTEDDQTEELPENEFASEDDEALAWAKENPNDPKAKEILEILKQRGVN